MRMTLTLLLCPLRQRQAEPGQRILPERQHEAGGELLQRAFLWSRSGPHWLHSQPVRRGVAQTASESQGKSPSPPLIRPPAFSAVSTSRPPGSLLTEWNKTGRFDYYSSRQSLNCTTYYWQNEIISVVTVSLHCKLYTNKSLLKGREMSSVVQLFNLFAMLLHQS